MRGMVLGLCLSVASLALPGVAAAQQAVSAELIRLHDALHLSDPQEAAWRDYTTAIAVSPQAQAQRRATTQLLPAVPTPRRIALIEAAMSQDAADFRRQGEAVIAFYGQLSTGQQQTFDRETLPTAGAAPAAAPTS